MFEFKKLCETYENLSSVEKGLFLTEKSVKILAKLRLLDLPELEPIPTLAGFIVGSVVADGKINEREYMLMYPALVRVFGVDFDLSAVKNTFECSDVRKVLTDYTEEMFKVLSLLDDDLKNDIVILCLCIVAIDGKVSFREKRYVKRLCKA